jgi:flavodoxin
MATVHPGHPTPRRTLVVCYSLTGHTRGIAAEIAAACHADVEEIVEPRPRSGALGYGRSVIEAALGIAVPLRPGRHAPQDYGVVVIGTPVWMWNMASPVRAWIHEHRAALPRIACFCTLGGSGSDKVLEDMARLCGRVPIARLAVTEAECAAPQPHPAVQRFASQIEAA